MAKMNPVMENATVAVYRVVGPHGIKGPHVDLYHQKGLGCVSLVSYIGGDKLAAGRSRSYKTLAGATRAARKWLTQFE